MIARTRQKLRRLLRGDQRLAPELDAEVVRRIRVIFDAGYYRDENPDVAASAVDPITHFLENGRLEHRRPSALFDPRFYLDRNPDVAEQGLDPLAHYLETGGAEGRDPVRIGFSSKWYLDQHPELRTTGDNPLVHFVEKGVRLGWDPSEHFDVAYYLEHYPDVADAHVNPLVHYLLHGAAEGRRPNNVGTTLGGGTGGEVPAGSDVLALLDQRRPGARSLRTIPGRSVARINLVTDSIGPDSLFGGVATSIILGALWAERTGRRLRIVTRYAPPDASGLEHLFRTVGHKPTHQPQLAFIPLGQGDYLDVGDDEMYLTTSWWSTTSVMRTIPARQVVYLLQEDERCFYPVGADWLGAQAAMDHPDLTVVVNTQQLLDALIDSGLSNLKRTATAFEPSFEPFLRPGRRLGATRPRNLFFYGRPNNPRNLFDLGLHALDRAVESGVLTPDRWRIHLVGRDLPPFQFCDGSQPVVHDALSWSGYHELLGEMDLGLSLMASPHPSYPPLDLAAGGSVVVTNNWPGKASLSDVSDRVLMVDSDLEAVVDGLERGARLVDQLSSAPFQPGDPVRFKSWRDNLSSTLDRLELDAQRA